MTDISSSGDSQERLMQLRSWEAAAEHEVDSLSIELANVQQRLNAAKEQLELFRRLVRIDEQRASAAQVAVTAPVKNGSDWAIRPDLEGFVEQILAAAGSPVHIKVIRQALIDRGVALPGRGDEANIIVRLSRAPDIFTRTARGTYALASWGLPPMARPARKRAARREEPVAVQHQEHLQKPTSSKRKRASPLALNWIFDPRMPSGSRQGGTAASYVFGRGLSSFVREVLQNSHDQKRDDADAVTITIRMYELEEVFAQQFLAAVGWDQLAPHLSAVADGTTNVAATIAGALEQVQAGRIRLLSVSDSGAHGLTGGEDPDQDSNYNNLCRNILQTSNDRGPRGGSHGLGKAVLWNFSMLKTVLFSSTLDTQDQRGLRVFGRTDLPSHETGPTSKWYGPGWYGQPDPDEGGRRAISAWDSEPGITDLASDLHLDRTGMGTGTSVLVVGFFEYGLDEQRAGDVVVKEVLASASHWFWPSMLRDPPTIRVIGEVWQDDTRVLEEEASIGEDIARYRDAVRATTLVSKAVEPGQVAEREIPFKVPERKASHTDVGHPPVEGTVNLRLVRSEGSPNASTNSIALIRGAGMVVQYWKGRRSPVDGGAFHGVLRVGQAHGSSEQDYALERFFRAAEPPNHDRWDASTDQMSAYRTGAKKALADLFTGIDNAIMELCDQEPPSTREGPALLARLFPLQGGGPGGTSNPTSFRVVFTDSRLADGIWTVAGKVRRKADTRAWMCTMALWLEAETGKGERVPLNSMISDPDGGYVGPDGFGMVEVPADIDEISFEMTAHGPAAGYGRALLARTRVRAEVHPRFDGLVGVE